jgi:Matrixin
VKRFPSSFAFLLLCFAASESSLAYVLEGANWQSSPVNVQMELSSTAGSLQTPPSFPLYDGSTTWEQVYAASTTVWNTVMGNLVLTTTVSSGTVGPQDGINEAFFGTSIAGYNLQPDDLAITVIYYEGSTLTEADTVFKSTVPWNSYTGPLLNNGNGPIDFRRVAIHELGHTIGLADINGTNPLAIMDIDISDIYYLTSDDIAGAQALYGAPASPTPSSPHPPLGPNRNGQAELVWQDTITGARSIWVLHDGVPSFVIGLPTIPTEWNIAAAADFLGTGELDLVWENVATGERSIWILRNGALSSIITLPTIPIQWHIATAADFLGTGQADLVWENTVTGERSIWIMQNGVPVSVMNLPTIPVQWHIAAAADFLGTGHADLVWENTITGERSIWVMQNGAFSSTINLPTISTEWSIADATDFLGTGQADLVWQNSVTGERSIWILKNGLPSMTINLPTIPTEWQIVD